MPPCISLRAAPDEARRADPRGAADPPVVKAPRRLLASLEIAWGNGREAWNAVAELPLDDSTAAVWQAFAQDAERRGQPLAARDALIALQRWRPDAQRALRAANLAIDGGDAQSALLLAAQAVEGSGRATARRRRCREAARVRSLGRGADAQRAYARDRAATHANERESMRRLVAWAWVRGGAVKEARAMLAGAQPDPDDELTGWLALYDGNLVGRPSRVATRRSARGRRRLRARVHFAHACRQRARWPAPRSSSSRGAIQAGPPRPSCARRRKCRCAHPSSCSPQRASTSSSSATPTQSRLEADRRDARHVARSG